MIKILCVGAAIVSATASSTQPSPDPLAVEQRAVAARRKIERAVIVLRRVLESGLEAPREIVTVDERIFLDGRKIRIDTSQHRSVAARPDAKSRIKTGKHVLADGQYIFHSDDLSAAGRRLAVVITKEESDSSDTVHIYDPRLLGMLPCAVGVFHAFGMEDFLLRADRLKSTITEVTIKGTRTLKVEYQRKDGALARIWIMPSKGHSVVRCEGEFVHPEGVVVDTIECQVRYYDDADVWFPTVLEYRRTVDGQVGMTERVEITSAEFNQAIDGAVFTLAGMNVPPGTTIVEYPPNPLGGMMWDGTRIARARRQGAGPVDDSVGAGGISRTWMLVALSSALLAAIFVYLWQRQTRQT